MTDAKLDRPSLTARRNALLAARLAAEHVPTCIAELATLAKRSKRESVRRAAANDLLRIATQLELTEELDPQPSAADDAPGKVYLLDPAKAAEVLRQRLEGK